MPDLNPTTALGSSIPRIATRGTLTLEENTGLALASLALRRHGDEPRPFGLCLPASGAWTSKGGAAALWTGPGQWLIEGSGQAEADFTAEVAAQCPGCSVTEQTDGFVAFEIRSSSGEAPILAFMSKLVNLDPSRFGCGTASRAGLEHMSVFVIRRAIDRLAVLGMRSTAATLWHALDTAALRLAGSGA